MSARGLLLAVTAAASVAFAPAAHAATHVVTFDDWAVGTTVTNQYLAADGVEFTQPADPGDAPVVQDGAGQAHSGTQVANFDTDVGTGENFSARFTRGELGNTATSISAYVGFIGPAGANSSIELIGYNAGGVAVNTSALVTVNAGAPMTRIEVDSAAADIKSFDVQQVYTGHENDSPDVHHVAIDDLTIVTSDAPQPPDFTLTNGVGVLDVLQGQSLDDPIRVNRVNGSNGNIAMSVSGLPTGMTGTFSPNPVPGTTGATTLTVTAAPLAAPAIDYSNVTITGTPTAGAGPTTRTATAIARISQNCTNTVRFDYVDLRDTGCLTKTGANAYYALNTEVHINGLVLTPRDGDHVLTVDPVAKTIKSDLGATFSVTIAGHPNEPFYYGPIDWTFTTDSTTPVPLDKDPTGKPKTVEGIDISKIAFLQGIPLTGMKVVFTASGKAVVTPTLTLDFFPFNEIGASGISASASFTTDNDHGADFSGFEIKIPDLNVEALELKDVDLKYVDSGTFSGSAKVVLDFYDKLTVGAGYGIKNNNFAFLKGSVGNINTPIGEGVYLQGLGFEVDTNPTTLKGQIELSAGPQVAGKTALSFDGGVTAVLADPWIVEVDGDAKVGGKYELASAFLRYSSFGLFEFGGQINWKFDPLYFNGTVTGWVAGLHNFDVEGSVHGCIDVPYLPDPCAGAKAIVSNIGLAACVEALGYGVGAGATWGGDFDAFTGCDLSPWRPTKPTARAAKALQHFNVPRGLPAVAWEVTGVGGAPPDVTVAGPNHESVVLTPTRPYVHNARFTAYETGNGKTYVVVRKPAAGGWTIANAGNTPITRIRQAVGLPKPSVSAKVSGHGRKRVLRWHLKPISGQVVRFAEIGKDSRHVITSTSKASGEVHFAPAPGSAGVRKIEAIVEQDKRPRTTLIVGSYRAPGMVKPSRVGGLKLTRKGTTLTVSWHPSSGGFRHAVYLVVTDQRRLIKYAAASSHSVSFGAIPSTVGATATITGLTTGNSMGPSVHATIKAGVASEPKPKKKAKPKKKKG